MSKMDLTIAAHSESGAVEAPLDKAVGPSQWTRPELVRLKPDSPEAARARAALQLLRS